MYSLGCRLVRVGWDIHFWLFNNMCFAWLETLTMLVNNLINIFLINPNIILCHVFLLTLFRMGGRGKKATPTSYSPVISTNVGFGFQNFLTFSFNLFATLVQNLKFLPSASHKLLDLNQDHLSKKAIFLVKSL